MTSYKDFLSIAATIFAALWIVLSAFLIYMSQQRANNGSQLTFATALTPAKVLLGGAFFFAGMCISLARFLPDGDALNSALFWGRLTSVAFVMLTKEPRINESMPRPA